MIMHGTEQEQFWVGRFGDEYTERNKGVQMETSNIFFWSKVLKNTGPISSCLEMGCNRGMNLDAIRILQPTCSTAGIEINSSAAEESSKSGHQIIVGSALDTALQETLKSYTAQLTLSCGVLIHINPSMLKNAYRFLFEYSTSYILISEYFSPKPEEISYRGHSGKLFKRDFAGDFLDSYSGKVSIVDYGFCWDRDPVAPKDNLTWCLFRKV
jgi:pseudaminic acid biosynthesis-associated methylase